MNKEIPNDEIYVKELIEKGREWFSICFPMEYLLFWQIIGAGWVWPNL
jgi:hypothetical protein